MSTEDRKRRRLAEREDLFLDTAAALLHERGFVGLTMDRVAEATEYSKGTVYQHFTSKEDLVTALICRSDMIRVELFERALTFTGTSRERAGAIGAAAEVFLGLFPEHFRIEATLRVESLRAKASPTRRAELEASEKRCLATGFTVISEAVAAGDLVLAPGDKPQNHTFGLWCLYIGSFLFHSQDFPLEEYGIDPFGSVLLRNANLLLDGMGWRPLSHEHDYVAARERALLEVFPDEARRCGLLPDGPSPTARARRRPDPS